MLQRILLGHFLSSSVLLCVLIGSLLLRVAPSHPFVHVINYLGIFYCLSYDSILSKFSFCSNDSSYGHLELLQIGFCTFQFIFTLKKQIFGRQVGWCFSTIIYSNTPTLFYIFPCLSLKSITFLKNLGLILRILKISFFKLTNLINDLLQGFMQQFPSIS